MYWLASRLGIQGVPGSNPGISSRFIEEVGDKRIKYVLNGIRN